MAATCWALQQLDVLPLAHRVAVAVADDEQRAVLDGDPLQAAGDLGEVRVGDVVHDHADRAALRPGPATAAWALGTYRSSSTACSTRWRSVVVDGFGAAVDDARRGGRRHAGPAGDVGEGDRALPVSRRDSI